MNTTPVSPPNGSLASLCLPAPRAKDLLLPAAAVAMGVFLAFGPYLRPSRSMKAALLTVPTLASLILLRVLRPPLPIPPSHQHLDTAFTLEGYLAANKTIRQEQHKLRSDETVRITGTCSVDIHRMWRDTYFSSTEDKAYFQLHLATKNMGNNIPAVTVECVEKLKDVGFSLEEIENLSIVWHQIGMIDLKLWLHRQINGHHTDVSAHFINPVPKHDAPSHRLFKICRENGELVIHYQLLCGSYRNERVDQAAECYVLGTRKINLVAGTDEMSYKASFDLSSLSFDES